MKILQKMAFGSDWGCFVWKGMPEGYKAGTEQSVQKNEYQQLWDKTKNQLEGLSDETVLSTTPDFEKEFDSAGQTLISTQLAEMFGETGSWEKMKDYPKTKFAMKKLTEMGLKINNPKDFIGKKLIIKNGNIALEKTGSPSGELELGTGSTSDTASEGADQMIVGNGIVNENTGQSAVVAEEVIDATTNLNETGAGTVQSEVADETEQMTNEERMKQDLERVSYANLLLKNVGNLETQEEKKSFRREAMRALAWGRSGETFATTIYYRDVSIAPDTADATKTSVLCKGKTYIFTAEELSGEWTPLYTGEDLKFEELEMVEETGVTISTNEGALQGQGEVLPEEGEVLFDASVETLSLREKHTLLADLKKSKKDAEDRLANLPTEKAVRENRLLNLEKELAKTSYEVHQNILMKKISTEENILEDIESGMHERQLPKAIETYGKKIAALEKMIEATPVVAEEKIPLLKTKKATEISITEGKNILGSKEKNVIPQDYGMGTKFESEGAPLFGNPGTGAGAEHFSKDDESADLKQDLTPISTEQISSLQGKEITELPITEQKKTLNTEERIVTPQEYKTGMATKFVGEESPLFENPGTKAGAEQESVEDAFDREKGGVSTRVEELGGKFDEYGVFTVKISGIELTGYGLSVGSEYWTQDSQVLAMGEYKGSYVYFHISKKEPHIFKDNNENDIEGNSKEGVEKCIEEQKERIDVQQREK